jgi:hypothetical protein
MTTSSDERVTRVMAACEQAMIACLYEAVDDRQLSWLDDLLISAKFLRRCGCGATAPTDEPCPQCGTTDADAADVVSMFDVYRCQPEAIYPILALRESDPPLEIRIAAAGGGQLGAAYADNAWIYGVWLDGSLVYSGADLRSGGIAHTHWQMAVLLAEYLANIAPAPLRRYDERLGQWAFDEAHPEREGDRDV